MYAMPSMADQDIIKNLERTPACISPKYLYDSRGSALFDVITRLPEYYLPRTERSIMETYGAEIRRSIGPDSTIIELGAGGCEKSRALCRMIEPTHFIAVDIAGEFVNEAVNRLQTEFPKLHAQAVVADLTQRIDLPKDVPHTGRVAFYPGSSIGNFDPEHAVDLLTRIHDLVSEEGTLLIGVDLVKNTEVLEAAYNDASNVTAAFNLNVLANVNHLAGSDFQTSQWCHQAFFNVPCSRIEMHLEATHATTVRWPGGQRHFDSGERIHTENSYKYAPDAFHALLTRAGFRQIQIWTDPQRWFAVVLARP